MNHDWWDILIYFLYSGRRTWRLAVHLYLCHFQSGHLGPTVTICMHSQCILGLCTCQRLTMLCVNWAFLGTSRFAAKYSSIPKQQVTCAWTRGPFRPWPPSAQAPIKYYILLPRNRTRDLSVSQRPLNKPMWVLFSPMARMNIWLPSCRFQYLISVLQVGKMWNLDVSLVLKLRNIFVAAHRLSIIISKR